MKRKVLRFFGVMYQYSRIVNRRRQIYTLPPDVSVFATIVSLRCRLSNHYSPLDLYDTARLDS